MPTTRSNRFVLLVLTCSLVVAVLVGVTAQPAAAHNSLLSSEPADGVSLDVAPTQITWTFDQAVPLDSMTVTLIEASGVRSELTGSVHGAAGDHEVVTPLPGLAEGDVTVRWRLVGPDGHPITGRISFTVDAAPSTTLVAGEQDTPSTTPASADTPISDTPTADTPASDGGDADEFSTPSAVRWALRYASYLAIIAVVGILLLGATVWADAGAHPLLRRVIAHSLVATAALAFAQLMVIASDVAAAPPWSAFGSIDGAMATDAGKAFAARIVLAIAMWLLVFRAHVAHPDVFWNAVSLAGLALLATWAFAGHASSMRWALVGVTTDVAHHAAAAVWITGLAVIGWVAPRTVPPTVLTPIVRRFSDIAALSVVVLVTTGLVQSVRLVGAPGELLTGDHGRLLALKLALLVGMLAVANANRRRVERRTRTSDEHTSGSVAAQLASLRRGMLAEFAIGIVIVAVTASMVVSPPATSDVAAPAGVGTALGVDLRTDVHRAPDRDILHSVVVSS